MFNYNEFATKSAAVKMQCKYSVFALLLASLSAVPAGAADAAAGAKIYKNACAKCHSVDKPMASKKAPSLLGIMGRSSARISGYKYSQAMRRANLTWTTEKLDSFLIDPKAVVPDNKMKFKGMAKAEDRADLMEFLQLQQ